VAGLPAGTVTFLFTDVEGSTRLLHELGDAYADVLGEHRRALRECFGRHGGVEVDTQGDASFVAFPKASEALSPSSRTRATRRRPMQPRGRVRSCRARAGRDGRRETLRLARESADERAVAIITGNLGYLALVEGREEDAEALLTTALELERAGGRPAGAAETVVNLALLALRRGDVTAAAERVAESLNLFRTAGTESGMYEALLLAAVAIERRGDLRTSLQLQASVRTHASARAYDLSAGEVELADEGLARIRGTLPAEEFAGEWSRGEQLHLDAAVTAALKSLD
jgi:hypothetical protein